MAAGVRHEEEEDDDEGAPGVSSDSVFSGVLTFDEIVEMRTMMKSLKCWTLFLFFKES